MASKIFHPQSPLLWVQQVNDLQQHAPYWPLHFLIKWIKFITVKPCKDWIHLPNYIAIDLTFAICIVSNCHDIRYLVLSLILRTFNKQINMHVCPCKLCLSVEFSLLNSEQIDLGGETIHFQFVVEIAKWLITYLSNPDNVHIFLCIVDCNFLSIKLECTVVQW